MKIKVDWLGGSIQIKGQSAYSLLISNQLAVVIWHDQFKFPKAEKIIDLLFRKKFENKKK